MAPPPEGEESDAESEIFREGLRDTHQLIDEYLVPASIFALLLGFYEYALTEIYHLVFPNKPLPERVNLKRGIVRPLKSEGIVEDLPEDYVKYVHVHRDDVRNAFAHGRWEDLKVGAKDLDLHEAFRAVACYFFEAEQNLKGHAEKFTP
ncbi:MAG: hypothetical protein AAF491_00075 [Verrucomicrobiota bacterium]